MSDGNSYGPGYARTYDGGGCLVWFMVFCLVGFGYMLARTPTTGTGGDTSTTSTTSTVNRTNAEFASRNQVNLWSDVTNCYGDGSCPTTIITNTTTTVAGDRSTVTVQGGVGDLPMCWDPALDTYTSSACVAGGQP